MPSGDKCFPILHLHLSEKVSDILVPIISKQYLCRLSSIFFLFREKEDEVKSLTEQNKQQAAQSEKSLADFKAQVEKNQTRMYDEMKQQVNYCQIYPL